MPSLTKTLLWLANTAFIGLFGYIAWHNRLAADDYYFLHNAQTYGAIGGMLHEYQTWATGWMAILLNQFVLSLYPAKGLLFVYHLVSLAAMIASVYFLLRNALARLTSTHAKPGTVLGWAILFVAGLFFSSLGIGETWFWFCSSVGYLWSLIAVVVTLASVLHSDANRRSLPWLALAALYIGGSSMPLGLFCLLVSFLALGWVRVKKIGWSGLSSTVLSERLIVFFLLLLASFLVTYLGEGRMRRASILPDVGLVSAAWINVRSFGILLRDYGLVLLPMLLLWSVGWIGFRRELGGLNSSKAVSAKSWLLGASLLALAAFAYLYPISLVLGDIGPARVLAPLVLLALLAGVAAAWLLSSRFSDAMVGWITRIWLVLVLAISLGGWSMVWETLPAFDRAYDARYEHLINLAATGNYEQIESVKALPPAPFLYTPELTSDTSYFLNQHYRLGLGLPFYVVVDSTAD